MEATTPKKSKQASSLNTTSTPSIARHTSTPQYASSLSKAREAIVADVASVEIVPLLNLLDSVLPVVQTGRIDSTLAALQRDGVLSSHGWECFKAKKTRPVKLPLLDETMYGPEHCSGNEDEVFLHFEDIYKAIMTAAANNNSQPALTLLVHGNQNPTTDWPCSTRPDATLHLKESSVPFVTRVGERYRVDHADVRTYFEWKKKDTEANFQDDCTKLVYNVHHRFRSDPCAVHVTGITIENTTTRLWYFDRSVILESQPFDFMKEPHLLIHVLLALSCGSRTEMGFDSTIKCVGFGDAIKLPEARPPDDKERQYEFEVHDNHDDPGDDSFDRKTIRKYRSVNCIANYGRIGIRGRGTSVYSVRPSDDQEAPLQVLKDSWTDADRMTEGKTLENIRTSLQSDPEHQQYLRHLLTPDCYGYVPNDAGERMETVSRSRWVNELFPRHSLVLKGDASKKRNRSQLDSIRGGTPRAEMEELDAPAIGRRGNTRKRCRTVFVEGPGKELAALETLEKVFIAIHGGLNAMLGMHHAGYIHRDLSVGNIILLSRHNSHSGKNDDVGVLIDLEYAKKFPDDATQARDVRTGTWEFVAAEARDETYLYIDAGKLSRGDVTTPWFRNPIHDVESCWWIACWSFYQFKHPELTMGDKISRTKHFGPMRFPLGAGFLSLDRVPLDLLHHMDSWTRALAETYRTLQRDLRDKEKVDSFDYKPIILNGLQHVESMRRLSAENYSTSWNLYAQPDGNTGPRKRIKADESSTSGNRPSVSS